MTDLNTGTNALTTSDILQQLLHNREQGKLGHAWLLYGKPGSGKKQLWQQLAHILLCQAPHRNAACGQCKSCLLLAAGTHPDYMDLQPEPSESGKTSTLRIDQIRQLAEFAVLTPQYATQRVVIIDPVDQMNLQAANALLKTLEEPTAHTLLLLVCHDLDRLLPTLRSRCQRIAMPASAVLNDPSLPVWSQNWLARFGNRLIEQKLDQDGWRTHLTALDNDLQQWLTGQSALSSTAARWKDHAADVLFLLADWCLHTQQARIPMPVLLTLQSELWKLQRLAEAGSPINSQSLLEQALLLARRRTSR